MHPPFFPVDHRATAPETHRGPVKRRGAPTTLDLSPTPANWPPVPLVAPPPPTTLDPGRIVWLSPPVHTGPRARFGRFLIRLGQRMLAPPRPV